MGAIQVGKEDEVMLVTNHGQMIRIKVSDVSKVGRNTQGVRLFNLKQGEQVVSLARCADTDASEADEKPETTSK